MKRNYKLELNKNEISVIKYGLSIIPDLQEADPEARYNKNLRLNNQLSLIALNKISSGNIDKLSNDEFRVVMVSIFGLHDVSSGIISIDKETSDFVKNNFFTINKLYNDFSNIIDDQISF